MTVQFAEAFGGKRVFVTGHTGFKGSWLCLWLQRLGAEVTGYSLEPPTTPNNFEVSEIGSGLAVDHRGDLRDQDNLFKAMRDAEPHVVMHLAAQSVVRVGYQEPFNTFETNVMGTASLLEAIRRLGHPCSVLCVTSDKCYENIEQVWGYRETDKFGDHDPYGGSKGAAEILIRAYRESFFPANRFAEHNIGLASARAGNVIGGGDWKEHALLADSYRALAENQPIPIRNPESYRPWQHVLQCLSGYLEIVSKLLGADAPKYCSGWNIGPLPGSELSVKNVIELFLDEWGDGRWIDVSQPGQMREANILRLNIDRAIWELDWKPCWTVEQAIKQTASWYRHYLERSGSMREYSLRQIADYEQAIADRQRTDQPPAVAT